MRCITRIVAVTRALESEHHQPSRAASTSWLRARCLRFSPEIADLQGLHRVHENGTRTRIEKPPQMRGFLRERRDSNPRVRLNYGRPSPAGWNSGRPR